MGPFGRLTRGPWQRPYLLLTLAVAAWGGNAVAARLAIGTVSPMAIVCLRWLVVVAVLIPTVGRTLAADARVLIGRWPYLLAMGALGFTAFNAIFYWAAQDTSAINIGVIQGLTPAVVVAGSYLAYGTAIRPAQVAGLLIALAGVVVTASRGDLQVLRELSFNRGDLGIVGSSLLFGGYTVALRVRPAVAPLSFFAALAGFAFLSSLPLLGWEVASGRTIWPGVGGCALILFIALGPSLLAQLFYMRGVELIGPARAGVFMNLIPVFAALGGLAVLGEVFAPYHALALALVLGGIWLAERRG